MSADADTPPFVAEVFADFFHHRGNGEGQKDFSFVEVEAVDGVGQAEAGTWTRSS